MQQFIELKIALFNIVFLWIRIAATAQSFPDLKFIRFSEKEGLSSNSVTSIAEDGDGILWAGTENGLNRFDGYGFAKFYTNPHDTNSIKSNEIVSIHSDQKNNLWIMTASGICRFNTISHKSTGFKTGHNTPAPFLFYDGSNIWFDKDTRHPYIVSSSALYRFTDSLHYKKMDIGFPVFSYKTLSFFSYSKIVEDKHGQLWAFRQNKIYRINNDTKKVEQEFSLPEGSISIYSLLFDSRNRCWVTTWQNGIYWADPAQFTWHRLLLPNIPNRVVTEGAEWKWNEKKFLVFATTEPSLLFIDEDSLRTHFYHIINPIGRINTPFVDRQDILWAPTTDGIYCSMPPNNLFDIIPVRKDRYKTTINDLSAVYNMSEEKSGYWISKRYFGGIFWYNKNWKLLKFWPGVAEVPGMFFDPLLATTKEGYDFKQMGNRMFVTTEWGIVAIDLQTLQKKIYQYPGEKNAIRLRTIVPENDNKWWIRSYSRGVFVFNPTTLQFTRHYRLGENCGGCNMLSANFLVRDKKGRLFVSTNEGLYQYNSKIDSFLQVTPRGQPGFGNSLMGMAADSSGLLWIGTDNGIIAYNPDSKEVVKSLSENNGIGQVQRISIDSEQNVWFNSVAGYWCWLRNRDRIIQFKYSQGLPYNDGGMFYTTSDGSVYAGGAGTVVQFHPKRLMNYTINSKVKIVEAFVNDTFTPFRRSSSGEKELVLKPDEHNLQVRFDVINYDQLENNLFFYKLKPVQKEWKQINNGNLSFNNLAPGDYELSVRGGNKLTGGFTNTDLLLLTIKPFWFQSWWFAVLCVITVSAIIYYIVFRRMRNIRKEAALVRRIAETEMMALRSQMSPHFIFNSLNGIEYFILQNEKRNASVYLNKFASLIRIILSNSRKDAVPFAEDMQSIRLYLDLELLRFNYNFCYLTDIDPALMDADYSVPPLLVQPFVENAIIHGFGYTDKRNLQLKIMANIEDDYINYVIEDNGVGRKVSKVYQALNKPHHESLGLKITEQRLSIFNEQHDAHSSINIEDLFDETGNASGTRVTVKIKTI